MRRTSAWQSSPNFRPTETDAVFAGALLRVDQIAVGAGKARRLDGVSFKLNAGEIMAILGANGAGKSTLLAALSGETALSGGGIDFAGTPLQALTPQVLAQRRALNAAEPPVAFALTAEEVVALGRPFSRVDHRAMVTALSEAHATAFALRDVATLSTGEQVRVQLARSRYQLGDARDCVWLLDEPCAHLDMTQRQFVLSYLQRMAQSRGWAVVFTTHDPAEAEAIADTVMLLREGRMLAVGGSNQVLTPERLSACYGAAVARRFSWAVV